jgi:hypothetical protein
MHHDMNGAFMRGSGERHQIGIVYIVMEDLMTNGLKTALLAGLTAVSLGMAGAASAMPGQGVQPAIATSHDVAVKAENVRLICPPYRPCYWVPGWRYGYYRPYGFYRPYYRPWGWHRWHRW